MRIGRSIIIPAIISLGVAGSVLAGSAISVAAGPAPTVQVQAAGTSAVSTVHYRN
jgi:hypothetical protein